MSSTGSCGQGEAERSGRGWWWWFPHRHQILSPPISSIMGRKTWKGPHPHTRIPRPLAPRPSFTRREDLQQHRIGEEARTLHASSEQAPPPLRLPGAGAGGGGGANLIAPGETAPPPLDCG